MRYGKVAVFTRPGEPIQIVEEQIRQTAPDEILVRVSITGICDSDVQRPKGDLPVKWSGVCFEHEAVGAHLESIAIQGRQLAAACWKAKWSGFRQYATLDKKCVYIRVPIAVPIENVITFGCGMPTALRGLKQLGTISPGDEVVIQGSGPVGLACTLSASLAGARSVIVIGDPDHRVAAAVLLGATCTMSVANTNPESRLEQVKHLTAGHGASFVVEAAGTVAAFPEGLNLLRMEGKYLILGLYSGNSTVLIDPVRVDNLNLRISGSLGLDVERYKQTVDIAEKCGTELQFADLITHRFSLDHLQEALVLVGQGIPIKRCSCAELNT